MQTREQKAEHNRKWREEHREQQKVYHAAYHAAHLEELRANGRARFAANRDKLNAKSRAYKAAQKLKVLTYYGEAKCACCGETEISFLSIDHIDGNGAAQRKEGVGSGWRFYAWLIKNNFPAGYQVLCHNCNMGKSIRGECPHKRMLPSPDYIGAWKERQHELHLRSCAV